MSIHSKVVVFIAMCCGACAQPVEEEKIDSHDAAPPALPGGTLCVLSADCAAGLHCDLGECTQDCNEDQPCDESRMCSARARCLTNGERDIDPPPSGENLGTFSVEPHFVRLLPDATSFDLDIVTGHSEPMRFRATSSSPFVLLDVSRGTVSGQGTLSVTLEPSTAGAERSGSVEIFSDLGSQVIQFLQPAGISGKYQGAMHYLSGEMDLGDARLGLSLVHRNGDLDVVFDPQVSLLFPNTKTGPASGFGRYSEKSGMSFTVQQVLPANFGGARNSLGRAIGRRLEVTLERAKSGIWSGNFKEKWLGISERAVELEGTISLYYRPNEPLAAVEPGGDQVLPPFEPPELRWSSVLAGTSYGDCQEVLNAKAGSGWLTNRAAALEKLLSTYSKLDQTVATRFDAGRTYQDIHEACDAEFNAAEPVEKGICAWAPALGCGLLEAAGGAAGRESLPGLFGRFYHALVAPALLMAQQHAVRALDRSLAPGGLATERAEYTAAVARLTPPTTWLLSPALLEGLDSLAAGEPGGEQAAARVTALGALGELLQLRTELEGERTRLSVLGANQSQLALVSAAQERAVLGLVEAALLNDSSELGTAVQSAALNGWLTPLDSAFGALLEGARAFGVPDGFVPFVWRAGDSGASNFEQMLALSNDSRLNEVALEDAYVQNQRAYEASEQALLEETLNVEASYGLELADICGNGFRVDGGTIEWQDCGKGDAGQFGVLLLQVEQADARVASSVARLQGLKDKIDIDSNTLAQRLRLEVATLSFISDTNASINALKMTEGLLDVAMEAIEVAANSNLFNGGAPAAMAAASIIIGVQKVGIGVAQDQLHQAQEMKVARQNVAIEELEGMAAIKKATIDAAQLALEITQDTLAKQEAVARANGLLDHAKELARLKRRTSEVLARDPARNPTFRLVRDQRALALIDARARSQRLLYLAARALEYEVNRPIAGLAEAVLGARSGLAMTSLSSCLSEIHTSYRIAYGTPQHYVSEVSVREMLGVHGPRKDAVTGETSSAGEQFRALTQGSQAFDPDGSLLLTFATNLQPDNGLWTKDVCADRITGVKAQLVGDGLGDGEAQIDLALGGAAVQRDCGSDELRVWSMSEGSEASAGLAVVQAGVNSYGEGEANRSLFGQSVARASWRLTIPSGDVAPSNADVDLDQLEDVLLHVEHQALPRRNTPLFVDTSCLSGLD